MEMSRTRPEATTTKKNALKKSHNDGDDDDDDEGKSVVSIDLRASFFFFFLSMIDNFTVRNVKKIIALHRGEFKFLRQSRILLITSYENQKLTRSNTLYVC